LLQLGLRDTNSRQQNNPILQTDFSRYIIYRCVVGSRAYGLDQSDSDVDIRGIYLPPADLEWSLMGVPEQLENDDTQECYWEIKKFSGLALKANPNILECLFSPVVLQTTPIADSLLRIRHGFLSKLVYQTYNGYARAQFRKVQLEMTRSGEIRGKKAMHLIRLLIQGVGILKNGELVMNAEENRDSLLAIRDGLVAWTEINSWRLSLHRQFDEALRSSSLPDAPDFEAANRLLIHARRTMVEPTDAA
jgi:uncharacterized protein